MPDASLGRKALICLSVWTVPIITSKSRAQLTFCQCSDGDFPRHHGNRNGSNGACEWQLVLDIF